MRLLYILYIVIFVFALRVWGESNIVVAVPDSTKVQTAPETAPTVNVEPKKELLPLLHLVVGSGEDTIAFNMRKQKWAQVFAPLRHAQGYCPCKKKKE